jgi:hypothetical protein
MVLPQPEKRQNEHDHDHQADKINDTVHLKSPSIFSGQHRASAPRLNNVASLKRFQWLDMTGGLRRGSANA